MNRKSISQREARALKRRVEQLESMEERRRRRFVLDYPGGVNIAQHVYNDSRDFLPAVIDNSRKLGHAVVVTADGATLRYYAIPHPDMPQ